MFFPSFFFFFVSYFHSCDDGLQLWMGTHPKGPATLLVEDGAVPLNTWVQSHGDALGSRRVFMISFFYYKKDEE